MMGRVVSSFLIAERAAAKFSPSPASLAIDQMMIEG